MSQPPQEQSIEAPINPGESEYDIAKSYLRRRTHLKRFIAGVALLDVLYVGAYKLPIALEEYRLSQTNPSLIQTQDTPNHLAAETIVVGGFGILSAEPIAKTLSGFGEIGAVYALKQDNRGTDPQVIAGKIMDEATATGQTEIGLWGDSIGGNLVTKVGRIIQESDSHLRVRFIALESSLTSFDSLQPDSQNSINTLQAVSQFLPDIAEHPAINYVYAQQQVDNSKLKGGHGLGIGDVLGVMNDPNQPSSTLLASQALMNVHNTIDDDLSAIAKVKNKTKPFIFMINPSNLKSDRIVNTKKAVYDEKQIVKKVGLPSLSISLPDISHGDPSMTPTEYSHMLKTILIPTLLAYDQSIGTRLTIKDRP